MLLLDGFAMRIHFSLVVFFALFLTLDAKAQEPVVNCSDTFCVPSIVGMPRAKGIEMNYERVLDYRIKSDSKTSELNDNRAEVRRNRRWEFKARIPVVLKPNIKIVWGLRYFVEEYKFEEPENINYPFYRSLEDKSLKSLGSALYVIKPFKSNRFFLLRASANLNGDYDTDDKPTSDFLRYSISPLYGIKKNSSTSYAFGLAYSYNFGRRAIYPILAYNCNWDRGWGLEAVLPVKVKVRYTLDDKDILYGVVGLHGSNYNVRLTDPSFNPSRNFFLEKSEIRYTVIYEREIYDFLWFGVEAGARSNLQFRLTEANRNNPDLLIKNDLRFAPLAKFSIFMVPPRRFMN